MRYIPLIVCFLLAVKQSAAQKTMGISEAFLVGEDKHLYEYRIIETDHENSKYLLGFFKGSISISGTTIYTSSASTYDLSKAIFLAKYDSLNNFLWLRKIAESDTFFSISMKVDSRLNYLLACDYKGKVYYDSDSTVSQGGSDILVLKFDQQGNLLFKKEIGGINGEGLSNTGVIVDEDDYAYISGSFNYSWTNNYPNYQLVFGIDTLESATMEMFVSKLDTSGNYSWARSYGGPGGDQVKSLFCVGTKLLMMGEVSSSTGNNLGGISFVYPLSPAYTSKCFIAALDSVGNGIWLRKFGTTVSLQNISANSLFISGNRVYFTGSSFSNNQNIFLFEGGPTLTGTDQVDYFIAAYDTSGNFKWNTISRSAGSEYLSALHADSTGNMYGIGKMNYTQMFPGDTLNSYGGDDVLVCSYDSSGAYRWAFNAGGSGADIGNAITADAQGALYIAGGTNSMECYLGRDTLYPAPGLSTFYYARLDSIVVPAPLGFTEPLSDEMQLLAFPNPAGEVLHIKLSKPLAETGSYTLYDACGSPVLRGSVPPGVAEHTIDLDTCGAGVYCLLVQHAEGRFIQKLIVQ